jgi:hypothetical protein
MKLSYYCLGFTVVTFLLSCNPTMAVDTIPQSAALFNANKISQGVNITVVDNEYTDGEWLVKVIQRGRDLQYEGINTNRGKGIRINGVKRSGSPGRKVYTWQNKNTSYTVTWKPSDPEYIRLQVTESGQIILNKLLKGVHPSGGI